MYLLLFVYLYYLGLKDYVFTDYSSTATRMILHMHFKQSLDERATHLSDRRPQFHFVMRYSHSFGSKSEGGIPLLLLY